MKVLFVVYIDKAGGDATLVSLVANQLQNAGIEVFFLAPETSGQLLRDKGFVGETVDLNTIQIFTDKYIKLIKPDLILFSNVPTIIPPSNSIQQQFNPIYQFIKFLVSYKIPVYTFSVCPAPKDRANAETFKKFFPPSLKFIFPCPYTQPYYSDDRIIYWKAYAQQRLINKEQKKEVRKGLNCKDDEKLLFISTSHWWYRELPANYHRLSMNLFIYYLSKLPFKIHLVWLAPKSAIELLQGDNITAPNIELHLYGGLMPMDRFEDILLSADLFVSEHYAQSSSIRAIMGNIPVFVINNDLPVIKSPERSKLYNINEEFVTQVFNVMKESIDMFLLHGVLMNSQIHLMESFFTSIRGADLFKPDQMIGMLVNIMDNPDFRKEIFNQRDEYLSKIKHLPLINEIF